MLWNGWSIYRWFCCLMLKFIGWFCHQKKSKAKELLCIKSKVIKAIELWTSGQCKCVLSRLLSTYSSLTWWSDLHKRVTESNWLLLICSDALSDHSTHLFDICSQYQPWLCSSTLGSLLLKAIRIKTDSRVLSVTGYLACRPLLSCTNELNFRWNSNLIPVLDFTGLSCGTKDETHPQNI